ELETRQLYCDSSSQKGKAQGRPGILASALVRSRLSSRQDISTGQALTCLQFWWGLQASLQRRVCLPSACWQLSASMNLGIRPPRITMDWTRRSHILSQALPPSEPLEP